MIWLLLRKSAAATLVAALAATILVAAFASSPASTQDSLPLLSATGCTDGTFVDTSTYPVVAGANNDLVDDCLALVAIRNHLATAAVKEDSLRNNRNHPLRAWGTRTQKIDTWVDITITSNRVTSFHLDSRGLVGSIPIEIGNLTSLTKLWLYRNKLTGSIPPQIGNLTNLDELYLGQNSLTGSIPAELGNLTNLTSLQLYNNSLTGSIPAELGNLTNLTRLNLSDNQLTGSIPAELGNLTNLDELYLGQNSLTGSIPAELGKLTNLTHLSLYRNSLTGNIPEELGNLTRSQGGKLEHLTLCSSRPRRPPPHNQFGTAPAAILSMIGTDCFSTSTTTSSTTSTTSTTTSTTSSTTSTTSTTSSTTTTSSPASTQDWLPLLSATGCTDGTFVDTSTYPVVAGANNDLVDDCLALVAIRNHLATAAVKEDSLRNNRNHPLRAWGTRTQKIDTWTDITITSNRVTSFDLNSRGLVGSIPIEIGNLTGLTKLWLYSNKLTGSIPPQIGNLTNLTTLWLSRNSLTGSIPAELGNLTNLEELLLYRNSITGNIPAELGKLTNLTHLYLYRNSLTGSIPAELGKLTNLTTLSLSRNSLTGNIPAELGKLTNLTRLSLYRNSLTGNIPEELGNLTRSQGGKLQHLSLCSSRGAERNQFGTAPAAIRSMEGTDCFSTSTTTTTSTTSSTTTTTSTTSSTTSTTTTTTTVPDGDERSGPLWNTLTIEQTGTTPSQIRQTLGLASNQAIYAWNTQTQTWQRLTNPNQPIPADTMLTFLTEQAISQANLEKLNLARGTQQTTLTAGWNIISIPEAITRNPDDANFLLADELTDCATNTAVIAVANYSTQTQQWQIWLPCNPASQARLTTGANPPYRPLTAIAPADTTYIYSRSAQTIAWNPDTRTYQTSTN